MLRLAVSLVAVCLSLHSSRAAHAAPQIDQLSPAVRPPSGRLLVFGSDFGGGGELLVDGRPAIVTQWSPTEIHAYVPEGIEPGIVQVEVVNAGEVSPPSSLEVVPRPSRGRVRWFFEMDRWDTRQFVSLAPDGTLYTSDALGLYAVSPGGALLWFLPGIGGGRPIAVAADGTIYAAATLGLGTEGNLYAIEPDGNVRWEFDAPSFFLDIVTGPNLGPDGNLYAYQDILEGDGLGFFSLTPEGDLRWSEQGDPVLSPLPDIGNSEIVFGPNRLYSGIVNIGSGGQPVTYALDLGGNQLWFTGNADLDVLFQSFPRADPSGRAIGVWGQTGLIALDPAGGTDWITVHPSQINVEEPPAIDTSGNIYAGAARSEMWSLTPDGEIRWVLPTDFSASLSKVGVSPDDRLLVAHQARGGRPTAIAGFAAADGRLLWRFELPNRGGLTQQVTSLFPTFTPDSSTAYITTSGAGPSADYSRVYAIDLSEGEAVRDELPRTD